jgi:hypothetical protein
LRSQPVALSLRIWLLLPDHPTVAAIITAVAVSTSLGYHIAWHPAGRRAMDVPWSQWCAANNGYTFGMHTPSAVEVLRNQ